MIWPFRNKERELVAQMQALQEELAITNRAIAEAERSSQRVSMKSREVRRVIRDMLDMMEKQHHARTS